MIRMAKPSDGPQVIPILNQIFEEMEIEQFEKVSQEKLFHVFEQLFLTEDYRYSYRRTMVQVNEKDQVQGIAVSFPEEAEAHVDAAYLPFAKDLGLPKKTLFPDKEAQPGEWYLDSLAVAADCQGQGIGGQLLTALKARIPAGYEALSLSVDLVNPGAKRLYLRNGFEVTGRLWIGRHEYEHMRYKLP